MKFILIGAIKFYRWGLRPYLSKTCLFNESCSVHVERITKESGFLAGINALRFRIANCQPGYHFIISGDKELLITKCKIEISSSAVNPLLLNKSLKRVTQQKSTLS